MFSFVDLAFLLLIAMTQVAGDAVRAPDLGEIIVPHIGGGTIQDLPQAANRAWQLRIHPTTAIPSEAPARPFELVRGPSVDQPERIDTGILEERLAELSATGAAKPLLAPHEDSRSRDLLDAVALLEDHWPSAANRRRALSDSPRRAQHTLDEIRRRFAGRESMLVAFPIGSEGSLADALTILSTRKWRG